MMDTSLPDSIGSDDSYTSSNEIQIHHEDASPFSLLKVFIQIVLTNIPTGNDDHFSTLYLVN